MDRGYSELVIEKFYVKMQKTRYGGFFLDKTNNVCIIEV
jgi:hypothetical protein